MTDDKKAPKRLEFMLVLDNNGSCKGLVKIRPKKLNLETGKHDFQFDFAFPALFMSRPDRIEFRGENYNKIREEGKVIDYDVLVSLTNGKGFGYGDNSTDRPVPVINLVYEK